VVGVTNDVATASDPSRTPYSESALTEKRLCDYVINVATGCRHGCKFCYVPTTPPYRYHTDKLESVGVDDSQEEWGDYVLYRDDLPHHLETALESIDSGTRAFEMSERGRGVFGISYGTDCYMDGRAGSITRRCVRLLAEQEHYARIQTRNPILALQDLNVFKDASDHVTVGTSLSTLDDEAAIAIEPAAPAPSHRLRGLKKFADAGVQVFVSVNPTYPTLDRAALRELLEATVALDPAVVFHEPLNPRGSNFELTKQAAADAGANELHQALVEIDAREQRWVDYQLNHLRWVQEIGADLDLPIYLWPDDQLIDAVDGREREWLTAWKERASPEPFAGREPPAAPLPELPPAREAATDLRRWSK
jgi:DNA repair photolyase